MEPPAPQPWHAISSTNVAAVLGVDAAVGLTAAEAALRLDAAGKNVLEETGKARWWRVLLRQFVDPLVGLLVAASLVSVAIGHMADAATILGIVVLNAVLGFTQEWKAERALESLRQMLAPRCQVVRDGVAVEVDADTLVPGDVVALEPGARVPADLRLLDGADLGLDESSLTGESSAVNKGAAAVTGDTALHARSCMAWMGTTVVRGRARGVVVTTGMRTAFGTVARLAQEVDSDATPLQRQLFGLGARIGIYGVLVSAAVAVTGAIAGRDVVEMFFTGVSLAVAVVPEGLPAVVTITLALGVRTLVRKKVLLRRLAGAETLGAATVVCTDKTGTLTRGEMMVQRIWTAEHEFRATGSGYDPAGHFEVEGERVDPAEHPTLIALLESAVWCNHARVEEAGGAWGVVGEPTEGALVAAAMKAWLPKPDHDPLGELPFDSTRKRMTVIEVHGETCCAHVKGAPEVILDRCTHIRVDGEDRPLDEAWRERALRHHQQLATRGLRVVAVARRTFAASEADVSEAVEQDLTFLGLAGLIDPPREEVPGAVALAQGAGIRVIAITGDAPETALAVAAQVGLEVEHAVTGSELDAMDDDALRDVLGTPIVFARTTPEHKLRIVSLLQQRGDVVGMTGDGVNDAPALKKADVGIAMGIRGTDAARGASDMVLTDDNFATILNAVEEGRRQYDNIQKFVRYLLSSNTGEVIAILVSVVIGGPLILIPVQILWTNLVTDGLTAVALGLEPVGRGVMTRPPRRPGEALLGRRGILAVASLGGYVGLATLALFYLYADPADTDRARTIAFCGLILVEKVNVLNFRSIHTPIHKVGFLSNPWLLAAIAAMLGLQLAAVYAPPLQALLHTVPLDAMDWVFMLLIALPIFAAGEIWKNARSRAQTS